MTKDRNSYPYYDDFNEDKLFYQLLFYPDRAVQARELSQIQSTIQKQIDRFGSAIYKEGAMIIPGESAVSTAYPYVKLQPTYSALPINLNNFTGKKIIGKTSGTVATVLQTVATDGTNPDTLYVKYETGTSSQSFTGSITNGSKNVTGVSVASNAIVAGALVSGTGIPANTYITSISGTTITLNNAATATNASASLTSTTASAFTDGEDISTVETSTIYSASLVSTNATGFGSKADIKRGVYFVTGFFCLVEDQTIILDAYGNTPSYKIGLSINDSFVTALTDTSLYDPANGFYNANAQGADRYKIELVLSKLAIDSPSTDSFVELIRIKDGIIQKQVTTTAYSELEKTLARRTYDESGDYTVRAFPVQMKEHLNDGTNNGVYTSSNGGDETKMVAAIEPGKAYVRGYEIELQETLLLDVDKARDTKTISSATVSFDFGNYIKVSNLSGMFNITTYNAVDLKSVSSTTIGTAKVRGIQYVEGTIGSGSETYYINLFDIVMSGSNKFSQVRTITDGTNSATITLEDSIAVLHNVDASIGLVQIPTYATKTVSDTSYIVRRYLSGTMSSDTITFTANTDEVFEAGNSFNYIVTISSASTTATGNGYANGDIIDMNASGNSIVLGGSPTGKQVTLTIPDISGSTLKVIATIHKTNTTAKTKTLTSRTQTIAHSSTIALDRADIFKIVSIIDTSTSEDITSRYVLDNGQRDNFYDLGSLVFNTAFTAPAGNVEISYQYFEHGVGDYFSVDSYDGVINYEDILIYTSNTSGSSYDLINCLDFRPRIANDGSGFSGTGADYSEFIAAGEDIVFDYEYYLGRIDLIFLDLNGNFKIVKGTSAISPVVPNAPDNGMVLYQVFSPPYTFQSSDVITKMIDNKRYTMRDIGKLETRISNLEYYTSMSLLEKDTADLFIDDGTGNNSFKNGFIVDNFKSHLVGDVALKEYECAVDPSNGILRPQFVSRNIGLVLNTGESSNYTKTGDLITLPYTEVSFISQPFATKYENINPYNIYTWIGSVDLTPSSDDWYEVQMTPDVVIQSDDGLANAYAALNGQVVWNDWTTAWVGQVISDVPVDTTPVVSVASSTTVGTPHGGYSSATAWARTYGRTPSEIITFYKSESIGDTVGGVLLTSSNTTGNGGTGAVAVFRDTVTREVGQTRTGYVTSVVPTTTTQVIDTKVLDTSTIPYMRSITIDFSATRMKPNTTVYPFFDNVAIGAYVTPTGKSLGDALVTDASGAVSGTFVVPDPALDASPKFRTGSRLFKLTDSADNNNGLADTTACKIFTAAGVLETEQNTILSTQSAELVTTAISEARVTTQTTVETSTAIQIWSDPLSQSFLIDQDGGVFLSKINLYFSSKDSNNIPVTLQIRNMSNGYPAQNIVPFSEVSLTPDSVNVSDDGTTATSFAFSSPVYLQNGVEYCFVLLSNSNEYTVYVSELGGTDLATGEFISSQPYAGVLFKSQNSSTWTASQEEDIKFDIYRCSFDTNSSGTVILKNDDLPISALPENALITTNSSTTVKVYDPNHGLKTGHTVTFSGFSGTYNNIPDTELNATHTVTVLDIDYYTFTTTTAADTDGSTGGTGIYTTSNWQLDVANVNIQNIVLTGTAMEIGIKTTDISGNQSTDFGTIALGQNLQLIDSQTILSTENEGDDKSIVIQNVLSTTMENISPVIDTTRMSIISVANRINNDYTNETDAQSGDSVARYITKQVTLSNDTTGVTVYFNALRPANATIKVYVKYLVSDSEENFDDQEYVEMDTVSYPTYSDSNFYAYQFQKTGLTPFTVFAIKIVMLSSDTADAPLISQFRAIATA